MNKEGCPPGQIKRKGRCFPYDDTSNPFILNKEDWITFEKIRKKAGWADIEKMKKIIDFEFVKGR